MKIDYIYAFCKCAIALIITITACVLVVIYREGMDMFKTMAVAVISYLFGQYSGYVIRETKQIKDFTNDIDV